MNIPWNVMYEYPLALAWFFYQYSLSFVFLLTGLALALTILFLQGKGDMGVSNSWQGSQLVFGGSGGQDFVSKFVWFLGFAFMFLCLIISKNELKYKFNSVFSQKSFSKKLNVEPSSIVDVDLEKELNSEPPSSDEETTENDSLIDDE
jgi:protein translocase SecG subunit